PAATSRTASSCAGYSVRSRAEAQATKASKTASSWRPAGTSSRSLSSSGKCTPSSLAAGTDSGPTLSGGGPLVVGLLGEEALELGADLVAGGQWLTARVEGIGAVPGLHELIELLLHHLDRVEDLRAVRVLTVDLLGERGRRALERAGRQLQVGDLGHVAHQVEDGRGVGRLREVLGHVHGEPGGRDPVFRHPQFEKRSGVARHRELARPRGEPADQV